MGAWYTTTRKATISKGYETLNIEVKDVFFSSKRGRSKGNVYNRLAEPYDTRAFALLGQSILQENERLSPEELQLHYRKKVEFSSFVGGYQDGNFRVYYLSTSLTSQDDQTKG